MGKYKDQQRFLAETVEEIIRCEQRTLLWITLNTHLVVSNRTCRSRCERMFYRLHRRCFRGAAFRGVRTAELMRIVGALERGPATNHSHAHALVWVHAGGFDKFVTAVRQQWEKVSPGGTARLDVAGTSPDDAKRMAWYLTKNTDRTEFRDEFFTEADLSLPAYGGEVRRKHVFGVGDE